MKSKPKRADKFVPQLLLALTKVGFLQLKFSSLPESYQDQPYNLSAKLMERGGIKTKVSFNKKNDILIITKQANGQKILNSIPLKHPIGTRRAKRS